MAMAEISTAFHVTGAGADAGGGGDRAAAAAAREYDEPALRSCLDALGKMQSFNNLARGQVLLGHSGGFSVD